MEAYQEECVLPHCASASPSLSLSVSVWLALAEGSLSGSCVRLCGCVPVCRWTKSISDPEGYWAERAKTCEWKEQWTGKVMDYNFHRSKVSLSPSLSLSLSLSLARALSLSLSPARPTDRPLSVFLSLGLSVSPSP